MGWGDNKKPEKNIKTKINKIIINKKQQTSIESVCV